MNPFLSNENVKNILMDTVDGTLPGLCVSGGRLNLHNAILETGPHWIGFEPVFGSIAVDGINDVNVVFNGERPPGTYQGQITIVSDDPYTPELNIPVTITIELIESYLRIIPHTINRKNRPSKIMAWLLLPKGITKDQIDANEPLILFPGNIDSTSQYVFQHGRKGHKRTSILAFFSKADLLAAVGDNGKVQVFVLGRLTTGQYFYGTDTIRIIGNHLKCLAILISHWLRTDCSNPHWCEGSDINQDGTVDFIDFAFFDGCCLEFIKN